ncbi:hypothetical protein ACFL40_02410 [candidate division KSB1 bacterium]
MKKVLFLSYYFPPMGMGGVQRVAKFCKYLPEFGWEPLVVTVKDTSYYAYDESLLEDIKNIRIIRTGSLDPLRVMFILRKIFWENKTNSRDSGRKKSTFFKKLFTWLLIPDSKVLWIPFAFINSIKVIYSVDIPVVFSTSPPLSSHVVGFLLKIFTKVKWAADFRDHWIINEKINYPTVFHRIIHSFIKKIILKNADYIIGVSNGIIEEMSRTVTKNTSGYKVIYNGYDEDDFPTVLLKKGNNKFKIVYAGTFNDIHPPVEFLDALKKVIKRDGKISDNIEFTHYGVSVGFNIRDEAELRGIGNIITEAGYVPHKTLIKNLLEGDLLLLIQSESCPVGMIPGKLFEYLISGIPILAVIPDGDAAELIRKHKSGVICSLDSEGLGSEIIRYYNEWKRKRNTISGEREFTILEDVKVYSRKNQAGTLASVFEDMLRK